MAETSSLLTGSYTIYCDDVREEVTGKVTLVGTYHDMIGISRPETRLARLFSFSNLRLPIDKIEEKSIHITVTAGEIAFMEHQGKIPKLSPEDVAMIAKTGRNTLVVPIELTPCDLKEGMELITRIQVDELVYESFPVKVIMNSRPEA